MQHITSQAAYVTGDLHNSRVQYAHAICPNAGVLTQCTSSWASDIRILHNTKALGLQTPSPFLSCTQVKIKVEFMLGYNASLPNVGACTPLLFKQAEIG